jgi:hypothetical protein
MIRGCWRHPIWLTIQSGQCRGNLSKTILTLVLNYLLSNITRTSHSIGGTTSTMTTGKQSCSQAPKVGRILYQNSWHYSSINRMEAFKMWLSGLTWRIPSFKSRAPSRWI